MQHRRTLDALAVLGAHLRATFPAEFTSQWTGGDWAEPKFRTTACVPLGVSGGEHVFRCPKGRVFGVDLVLGTVAVHVGLMPEEWATPPSLVTPRERTTATWGN